MKISLNDNYYCNINEKHLNDNNNYNFLKNLIIELQNLDKFDTFIESSESTFERIKIFNKTLIEHSTKLNENEKILTIGHSIFFKHLTLIEYNADEFEKENYAYLKNCEIVSYYI